MRSFGKRVVEILTAGGNSHAASLRLEVPDTCGDDLRATGALSGSCNAPGAARTTLLRRVQTQQAIDIGPGCRE